MHNSHDASGMVSQQYVDFFILFIGLPFSVLNKPKNLTTFGGTLGIYSFSH